MIKDLNQGSHGGGWSKDLASESSRVKGRREIEDREMKQTLGELLL